MQSYSWGTGKNVVYLVHGWESHAGRMAGFVAPLLGAGYRVVAFDMPGHGRSARQRTDLKDFARALWTVTQHFGPPYGVIAHSLGATATLFADDVTPAKLVLIAPMRALSEHVDLFDTVVGLSPGVKRHLIARLERHIGAQLGAMDATRAVQRLAFKGLVIHDRADRFIPHRSGRAVAAAWGAPLRTTRGLGHRKILSDPGVVASVLTYLSEA